MKTVVPRWFTQPFQFQQPIQTVEMQLRNREIATPFVSAGKRVKKVKCKRNKLKFREMIVIALKDEKKDSTLQKIIANIEGKYNIRNDFVVRRTLEWMLGKKMIRSCGGKYHLVTEKVKLCGPPVSAKRRRSSKKCRKRKSAKKSCRRRKKASKKRKSKKRSRKCAKKAKKSRKSRKVTKKSRKCRRRRR